MKPHIHGVCKDILIRLHVFSNEANSFSFLLNKTKEKVFLFCFGLVLIGIRLINVKIER